MTPTHSISSHTEVPTTEAVDRRRRIAVRDPLVRMDSRATGQATCFGSVDRRDLGDLYITDRVCRPAEGIRGGKLVRRADDTLLLVTASAGRQIIETPDETVVLRPGTVLLMSSRTRGRFIVPHHLTKRTVKIPMTALSPFDMGGGVPGCLLLETTHSPLAGLLQDFLIGMDSRIDRMSLAEIEGTRNALLALIASLIRANHSGVGDFLTTLRRQLEAWVLERLSGSIRVADLAAAHGISPRTVHRAFASADDTVGSFVRKHRLAAARGDLVGTNIPIAAIAHRWGFCDASHFGREFRRQFSLSPGDYRKTHGFA